MTTGGSVTAGPVADPVRRRPNDVQRGVRHDHPVNGRKLIHIGQVDDDEPGSTLAFDQRSENGHGHEVEMHDEQGVTVAAFGNESAEGIGGQPGEGVHAEGDEPLDLIVE